MGYSVPPVVARTAYWTCAALRCVLVLWPRQGSGATAVHCYWGYDLMAVQDPTQVMFLSPMMIQVVPRWPRAPPRTESGMACTNDHRIIGPDILLLVRETFNAKHMEETPIWRLTIPFFCGCSEPERCGRRGSEQSGPRAEQRTTHNARRAPSLNMARRARVTGCHGRPPGEAMCGRTRERIVVGLRISHHQ